MSRPKGSKNKVGAEVKSQIVACYERLGGLASFEKWAKAHENEFYRIYAQLAPKELTADIRVRDESDLSDGELAAIATASSDSVAEEASGEAESTQFH